ncbi:hypothetical protein CBL_08087 [Carabus blaptoides fortunei]
MRTNVKPGTDKPESPSYTLCNESCIDRRTEGHSVVEHSTTTVARRRLWHRTRETFAKPATTTRKQTQRLNNSTGSHTEVCLKSAAMLKDKCCGVTSLGLRRERCHVQKRVHSKYSCFTIHTLARCRVRVIDAQCSNVLYIVVLLSW